MHPPPSSVGSTWRPAVPAIGRGVNSCGSRRRTRIARKADRAELARGADGIHTIPDGTQDGLLLVDRRNGSRLASVVGRGCRCGAWARRGGVRRGPSASDARVARASHRRGSRNVAHDEEREHDDGNRDSGHDCQKCSFHRQPQDMAVWRVEQEQALGGEWTTSTPSAASQLCDWPIQYTPNCVPDRV